MLVSKHRQLAWKLILIFSALLAVFSALTAGANSGWQLLAPGMELRRIPASIRGSVGDSQIIVLRMNPDLWQLEFVGAATPGETLPRTARAFSQVHNFVAAINAGMFDTDGKSHLGYLRFRGQVSNPNTNAYRSVAAFDPGDPKRSPRFHIFDLDDGSASMAAILKDYGSVVQNLRLIKRPGASQWSQQLKKWSEAALGEDDAGRILFIFCRTPFTMHDLNRELLSAGIGLVAAQHLEGGPEAQLYVHAGDVELELFGSYETAFREDDSNVIAWPVPNILGVRPRPKK